MSKSANSRGYKNGDTLYCAETGVLLRYNKSDDAWYNAGSEHYSCFGDLNNGRLWEFVGRFR